MKTTHSPARTAPIPYSDKHFSGLVSLLENARILSAVQSCAYSQHTMADCGLTLESLEFLEDCIDGAMNELAQITDLTQRIVQHWLNTQDMVNNPHEYAQPLLSSLLALNGCLPLELYYWQDRINWIKAAEAERNGGEL